MQLRLEGCATSSTRRIHGAPCEPPTADSACQSALNQCASYCVFRNCEFLAEDAGCDLRWSSVRAASRLRELPASDELAMLIDVNDSRDPRRVDPNHAQARS